MAVFWLYVLGVPVVIWGVVWLFVRGVQLLARAPDAWVVFGFAWLERLLIVVFVLGGVAMLMASLAMLVWLAANLGLLYAGLAGGILVLLVGGVGIRLRLDIQRERARRGDRETRR